MKSEILSILLLQALLPVVCLPAVAALDHGGTCPMKKMQVERLPDLHEPRAGHVVLLVDGEPMVFGGHTSGFVPLATAERYSNGEWHLQPMTYSHDEPVVLPMESGKIVIAGGHEKPLGIGQTFTLELYHQAQQSFEGYGCLDVKRCFAQGMEIDSGRVVISGNWYHDDNIECFDGSRQCLKVKEVAQHRSLPYILRTAKDNAIGGTPRSITAETITVTQEGAEEEVDAHQKLYGTWVSGTMTVTFGEKGSYKLVETRYGGYTQSGTYKITDWLVSVSSGGDIYGKLDETHTTSTTGKTKTNTGVGFWISADGKKLSYDNYSWTKK